MISNSTKRLKVYQLKRGHDDATELADPPARNGNMSVCKTGRRVICVTDGDPFCPSGASVIIDILGKFSERAIHVY